MIQIAIINALIIYGLYWAAHFEWNQNIATAINYKKMTESDVDPDSKMILWRFRFYALKWLGGYWSKPVITCPICMSSIHSTYVYFYFIGLPTTVEQLFLYSLHILMTAGIGAIIVKLEQ